MYKRNLLIRSCLVTKACNQYYFQSNVRIIYVPMFKSIPTSCCKLLLSQIHCLSQKDSAVLKLVHCPTLRPYRQFAKLCCSPLWRFMHCLASGTHQLGVVKTVVPELKKTQAFKARKDTKTLCTS